MASVETANVGNFSSYKCRKEKEEKERTVGWIGGADLLAIC